MDQAEIVHSFFEALFLKCPLFLLFYTSFNHTKNCQWIISAPNVHKYATLNSNNFKMASFLHSEVLNSLFKKAIQSANIAIWKGPADKNIYRSCHFCYFKILPCLPVVLEVLQGPLEDGEVGASKWASVDRWIKKYSTTVGSFFKDSSTMSNSAKSVSNHNITEGGDGCWKDYKVLFVFPQQREEARYCITSPWLQLQLQEKQIGGVQQRINIISSKQVK